MRELYSIAVFSSNKYLVYRDELRRGAAYATYSATGKLTLHIPGSRQHGTALKNYKEAAHQGLIITNSILRRMNANNCK